MGAFREAHTIADDAGDPEAIFLAAGNLSEIDHLRGAFALAEREIQVAREAAERSGLPDLIVQAWCGSGMVAFLAGGWDEAERRYARAEELARAVAESTPDRPFWAQGVWTHRGMLLLARGQAQEARLLLEEAIAQAEREHDQPFLRIANAALSACAPLLTVRATLSGHTSAVR